MGLTSAKTKIKPTPEEIAKAKEEAQKKVAEQLKLKQEKLAEQVKGEQSWLDEHSQNLSDDEKDELFRQESARCKETARKDGRIIIACPMAKGLKYCVEADPFSCPNGKAKSEDGCLPSDALTQALRDEGTCIDASFVSEAEGGSYMSPYVPWGPLNGKTKKGTPILTTGNSSGVTIGTGVDLGVYTTDKEKEAYLKRLEKAGVSAQTLATLKPLLGNKKSDACKALRELKNGKPLVLPAADVELIDKVSMQESIPRLKAQYKEIYAKRVKSLNAMIEKEQKAGVGADHAKIENLREQLSSLRKFGDLTCVQQTILFSTSYHEGNITKGQNKQDLVNAFMTGDDGGAIAALLEKTMSSNKLIGKRGERELAYLGPE
jgi:hypothetical protein